jgi:chromosomal replication initiator protein
VRAVDAVAEAPGRRYNPLFIVGPSGVGKTHLLNALGNELVSASRGTAAVACIGAQAFIDELIAALRDGAVERWSARYRDVDALLLDDVQFVAGKERTQDELFHVFNALHSAGRQIVLASDRPPREITGLEERLRSRFEGGLVVEIQPPDRELRAQLYRRFVHGVAPAELDELVAYLADRPVDSVRELIGIVQRLSAAADAVGAPLSLPIARGELEPQARAGTPVSGMPVVRAAADVFFLDDEKVVWDWPDIPARLIEEPR